MVTGLPMYLERLFNRSTAAGACGVQNSAASRERKTALTLKGINHVSINCFPCLLHAGLRLTSYGLSLYVCSPLLPIPVGSLVLDLGGIAEPSRTRHRQPRTGRAQEAAAETRPRAAVALVLVIPSPYTFCGSYDPKREVS